MDIGIVKIHRDGESASHFLQDFKRGTEIARQDHLASQQLLMRQSQSSFVNASKTGTNFRPNLNGGDSLLVGDGDLSMNVGQPLPSYLKKKSKDELAPEERQKAKDITQKILRNHEQIA